MNIQSALVRSILEQWKHYEWTIQGMGMARVKIADDPWPLKSTIISGEMLNQRFSQIQDGEATDYALPYHRQILKTGEGGGLVDDPQPISLRPHVPEFYSSGCLYVQAPDEIHRSQPQDGTVTLMERPMGPPLQETFVYWPRGMEWVSAEPRRPRNEYELTAIIALALARWEAA